MKVALEEIAPNRFVIHDPHIRPYLKGEGQVTARLFELTTWRRAGLLARLRMRGFGISTLADQIANLPMPPAPQPLGNPGWRPLTHSAERYSAFEPSTARWTAVASQQRAGVEGVELRAGMVLRRRKGRGPGAFYQAIGERSGNIGLRSLDEISALLAGWAQTGALAVVLHAERQDDHFVLPEVELPPPYRAMLRHIATKQDRRTLVDEHGWLLAQELFAQLGVRLEALS